MKARYVRPMEPTKLGVNLFRYTVYRLINLDVYLVHSRWEYLRSPAL